MVPLIHHKRVGRDRFGVERDLVGVEEVYKLGRRPRGAWGGHEADIVRCRAGGGALEDAEAVPVGGEELALVREDKGGQEVVDGVCVGVFREGAAEDDEGALGGVEFGAKVGFSGDKVLECVDVGAEVVVPVGGVDAVADEADFEAGVEPAFADAGVEDGGFVARVCADEEDGVGLFDAWEGWVEEVV